MNDRLLAQLQSLLGDRYRIERELARGGMSTVYLARDARHDRNVAIKLLQPELTTAMTAERFLREIRITARLHHPNILPLLDSGAEGGLCYYVMPHVVGESLRERLMWERSMPVGAAVRIARQIAEALNHAHLEGVVHRDIKPENILLVSGQPVVADFGLARAVSEAGASLTAAGMPIGTPTYMSPEQATGSTDVDGRSDEYSLGCVLFEMLAGRPPFVGNSVHVVIRAHIEEAAPSLCAIRPEVPRSLEAVVHRMLAKIPEERFPSLGAVSERLALIAAEEALDRTTPTELSAMPEGDRAEAEPEPLGHTPPALKGALMGLAILVVGVLAVYAAVTLGGNGSRVGGRGRQNEAAGVETRTSGFLTSIAAMPLETFGGGEALDMLGMGITEELIAQLARIKNLKVISRTSVTALKGRGLTIPQIADTLGVRHVLEGSIQRDGDSVRVTLQLIDARSDTHVWTDSYTRPVRGVIGLREEIATKVSAALAVAVPGIVGVRDERAGTQNEAAHDAFLRGMHEAERTSPAALSAAISAFREALRDDPRYAEAAAHLSDAMALWVHLGYGGMGDPYRIFGDAIKAATLAVSLDPNAPGGWFRRGMIKIFAFQPVDDGLADLERALALAPNSGEYRIGYAIGLARAGRYAEALAASETGAELDPLSPISRGGGYALTALGARRYDIAIREANRSLRLDPEFEGARVIAGVAELLSGKPSVCASRPLIHTPALRAACLYAAGDTTRASALVDSLRADYAAGRPAVAYDLGFLAAYHAQRGDLGETVKWLEKTFELSPTGLDFRFIDAGLFAKTDSDPAFKAALERARSRVRERVGK